MRLVSRFGSPAGLLVATALTLGCGEDSSSSDVVTVRDSAGIEIVENPARGAWAEGEGWTVSESHFLDLGALGGEEATQFHDVNGAVRLSDGRVVVANGGTGELRFFGPEGEHLLTTGGEGEGPGEFRNLYALERAAGDTLLAYDWRERRVSAFGPDGSFLRAHRLQAVGERFFFPRPVGWLAGRTFVGRTGGIYTPASPGGLNRDTATLLLYRPDGSLADTLARLPGSESFAWTGEGTIRIMSRPFGKGLHASARGELVAAGTTDRYEVRVYDGRGTLRRIVRKRNELQPVTSDDFETWMEERLSRIEDPDDRRERRRDYREIPLADRMPAYGSLRVGAGGYLWVQEHDPPGTEGPARWSVFDPDGRLLGEVTVPRRFSPHEIGHDYVLGVFTDELDVEHVRLYRLRRSG